MRQYKGWASIVLGMHDALVSTLGLVIGLVSAGAGKYTIILTAIIACMSAAMSMTASQYLAERANNNTRVAFMRGMITGGAYFFTACMLVMPFVFISNTVVAATMMYIVAVSVIGFFNYVKSVLSGGPFWSRFLEMLLVCFIVTGIAFVIGECAKSWLGITI